jgi:hypothetical protein
LNPEKELKQNPAANFRHELIWLHLGNEKGFGLRLFANLPNED